VPGVPGVYRSEDGGDSWDPLDVPGVGTANFEYVEKLDISATDPNFIVGLDPYDMIVVGDPTTPHIVFTEDGGDTWEVMADDRPYTNMAVLPTSPPTVVASVVGDGILQVYGPPLDPSSAEEWASRVQADSNIPIRCVPNPFGTNTTIRCSLREHTRVSLTIYDVAGRVVRRLADGREFGAGPCEFVWDGMGDDGRSLGSGVYFYRMKAGSHERVHRVLIAR
jgi:hypothetical protein